MESQHTQIHRESKPSVHFDCSYVIISIPGLLKIFQLTFNLIGFILIEASGDYSHVPRSVYFLFVSGSAFVVTLFLLILYLFHVVETLKLVPWLKIEFVYCVLCAVFYLIAACITVGLINGYLNMAGYFAFAALALYVVEGLHKMWSIKTGRVAQ